MSLVLLLKAVGYAAVATVNCYFYRMMGELQFRWLWWER